MNEIHSPLPPGNFIRLLEIQRVGSGNEVVGNLKVVSLSNCQGEYVAISYAWEDPAPVSRLKLVDGRTIPLNETLSDLLAELGRRHQSLTLWVDAICIDQRNMAERESQVQMMGRVYSSAYCVLLWLGASDAASQAAFHALNSNRRCFFQDYEAEGRESLADLETVFFLLARPWFRRTWVIQEFVLNREVLILCGKDEVGVFPFHFTVCAIWRYLETLGDYDNDHPAVRGLWNVTRMLFIRGEFQGVGKIRFERLLEAAHHCEASDARDMVFGFFGIADRALYLPKPTYEAPVEQVYMQAAEALILSGRSLDLLALGGMARRASTSRLPAWVPDPRNRCHDEPIACCDRAKWNAGGALQTAAVRVGAEHIRLCAVTVDVVTATCPPINSRSVAQQKAAMGSVLALRQMLPRAVSDEEWCDLLAVNLIMGLSIDDEPAGPEYRQYFIEWFKWLQSSTSEVSLDKIKHNRFYRTMGPRMDGWGFCLTERGYLCVGPPDIRLGDVVCYVPGCRLPLVLRPIKPGQGASADITGHGDKVLSEFALVSWCFAQGLMAGEGLVGKQPSSEILLC